MKVNTIIVLLVLCMLLPGVSMAALEPADHPLFDGDAVHEIHLTFHQTDWWNQLTYNYEHYEDIPYIEAEFDWGTVHFDDIGVRFKGNSSYMSYNGYKKSFKLDIDEYTPGQTIYGLDKLNLNNGFLDPSLVREKCAYELCDAVGLPTERTNYAAVYINGTYWGLYVLIEQFDQEFIESRFGPGEEGNLWKGEPHGSLEYLGVTESSYYDDYELKTNEDINDWSALVELTDKLNNTALTDLPDTLHNLIDVNSAMAMIAIDNFVVNLDSYIGRCVNYYFYHRDLDSRVVFAKWDQNEAWGIFNQYNLSSTQMKQLSPFWVNTQWGEERPLAERLWQISTYNDLYLGHMKKLMAGAAQPDTLLARMEELRDLIRPYVYMETNNMFTTTQFENAISSDIYASGGPPPGRLIPGLESFIRTRDTYLQGQIGTWTPIEGLVLNELMANNNSSIADELGDYEDWIEVANVGTASINLLGLGLTDHMEGQADFIFPDTTLAPGEYIVVWADEEPGEGSLHAPFKLDSDGEEVYLVDGAVIIDQVTFPVLPNDISWGRWENGSGGWQLLSMATPGTENQNPEEPEEVILFINEFMAINDSTIQDETGTYEDWVEIYNPGPDPVEMGGIFLTDDLANTTQWAFPDTALESGGFLLVWCDNDEEDGLLHTNFKLNGDGEEIGLFGRLADGNEIIDSYDFGLQTTDTSYGRYPNGTNNWQYFYNPTPGASNNDNVNSPPEIEWTLRSPDIVTPSDTVHFSTKVTDDHSVFAVTLGYYIDGVQGTANMFDDGNHHDSLADDDIYGSSIPPQTAGTLVEYYIIAYDDSGKVTFDPVDPNVLKYSYEVGASELLIYINEFMADNEAAHYDPDGDSYSDWFELYNAGTEAIDLSGMFLTDDLGNPMMWEIPDGITIGAGDYVTFWADDAESLGDYHTNFKLSASGEEIGLFNTVVSGNGIINSVTFEEQKTDTSYGRCPDGSETWMFCNTDTPGSANDCNNFICGDVNADGYVNLLDILSLISYIYGDPPGPEPDPLDSGDVNADGDVNLLDILYLIEFIYCDPPGPEPQCQ